MKKNIFCFSLLLFFFAYSSTAQNRKIIFGGTASIDIGSFQNRIILSPYFAKAVLPKLYAGVNLSVAYFENNTIYYRYTNQSTVEINVRDGIGYLGGGFFLRYQPFEDKETAINKFYLELRYEYLRGYGNYKDDTTNFKYETVNQTIFFGLGYKFPLSKSIKLSTQLSFRLNKKELSSYGNTIFQLGLEF